MKRLVVAVAALALLASPALADNPDWTQYAHSFRVRFPGFASPTTLTDFPVLVRLPASFDYEDCAAGGADLRFEGTDGSLLAGPDIVSRGFVYMKESEEIMDEIKETVYESLGDCQRQNVSDAATIRSTISDDVKELLYHKTKRSPIVLPVVQLI